MAARLSRAGLRALVRELTSAPAAFTSHGGAAASARMGARFCSSSRGAGGLPAPPSSSCWDEIAKLRNELLQLRRECLDENNRIFDRIDDLFKINHELKEKMVLLQAQNIKHQMEAVRTMVHTTYCILASCGAFLIGGYTILSPLVKSNWQHDTLNLWEERMNKRSEEQGDKRPPLSSGMLKHTPSDDQATGSAGTGEAQSYKGSGKLIPSGQVAAAVSSIAGQDAPESQSHKGSGKLTSSDQAAGHKAAKK